jgi:hypothetical protein
MATEWIPFAMMVSSWVTLGISWWLWLGARRLRRETELTLKLAGRIHAESELLQKQAWNYLQDPRHGRLPEGQQVQSRGH